MIDLPQYERKVYSQFTEDGLTLELVRRLNPTKYFVEIGAGHNGENNTHALFEQGWNGLWIDSMGEQLRESMKEQMVGRVGVRIRTAFVTVENIKYCLTGASPNPGVLSIDIDGNDYWLWKAVCEGENPMLRPSIVIIEAQIQKPFDEPYVMPYDAHYIWDQKDYDSGASIYSLVELGKELGYTFIGKCPDYHSPNLFFTRGDLALC